MNGADDKLAALERLSRLKADGIVTEAEFAAEKAAILAGRTTVPTIVPAPGYPPSLPPAGPPTIIYAQPPQRRSWFWRIVGGLTVGVLATIFLGVIRDNPSGGGSASSPAQLPACDSSDAKETLTSAIEHNALEKITSVRVLDIANVTERSFDPATPARTCAAELTLNIGTRQAVYEMHFNSDRSGYILQMQGNPAEDTLGRTEPLDRAIGRAVQVNGLASPDVGNDPAGRA